MPKPQPARGLPLMREIDELDLYRLPGHLIRRMHQVGVALFDTHITQTGHDLTPVQFAALRVIAAYPGLDQASLASAIAHDRVTTGGVVDRLVAKGFIRRDVKQTDRRSRELFLMPEGETILGDVTPLVKEMEASLMRGLSSAEGEIFLNLLKKNLAAINETSRAPLRMVSSTGPQI
jgi:MarR family transcriptional regulator, temperature-dependent positive regulator of motility